MSYDNDKLDQLIARYRHAETRRQERNIETEILEETVWGLDKKHPEFKNNTDSEYVHIPRPVWNRINNEINTDDKELKQLLRNPCMDYL
jgi:hypothetical protein